MPDTRFTVIGAGHGGKAMAALAIGVSRNAIQWTFLNVSAIAVGWAGYRWL